jgi:hypothetical protein
VRDLFAFARAFKSVRNVHIALHKALEDARRKKVIPRNPADDADPPRQPSPGSNKMKTWTRPQLNAFLITFAATASTPT